MTILIMYRIFSLIGKLSNCISFDNGQPSHIALDVLSRPILQVWNFPLSPQAILPYQSEISSLDLFDFNIVSNFLFGYKKSSTHFHRLWSAAINFQYFTDEKIDFYYY